MSFQFYQSDILQQLLQEILNHTHLHSTNRGHKLHHAKTSTFSADFFFLLSSFSSYLLVSLRSQRKKGKKGTTFFSSTHTHGDTTQDSPEPIKLNNQTKPIAFFFFLWKKPSLLLSQPNQTFYLFI